MDQFMMSQLKWATITKLGVCPGPASSRHWTYDAIGWTDVHRKSVKVKVSTLMYGQFSLATGLSSLVAYSKKESHTYSYIENCRVFWLCLRYN